MKKLYAISSNGKTLKSYFDTRFGSCGCIVIFDAVKKDHAVLDNPFKDDADAGIKLVGFLEKNGVAAVITGEVEPLVQEKLAKSKIRHIILEENHLKIEEILATIKIKE